MGLLATVTLSVWILVKYNFCEPNILSSGSDMDKLLNGTDCQMMLTIRYNESGDCTGDALNMKMLDFTCKKQNCGPATETNIHNIPYSGDGSLSKLNTTCLRTEPSLIKCNVLRQTSVNSSHHQVSVECKDDSGHIPRLPSSSPPPPPEPLKLRLIGADKCSGVLEVYKNKIWGTVSSASWTKQTITSVCQHLSCGNCLHFWNLVLDREKYSPLRWSLAKESCKRKINEDACFADQDSPEKYNILSMACSASTLKLPVRMVKSMSPGEENVEVFYENSWQVFCDIDWTFTWAEEVCRDHGCMRALRASELSHSKSKLKPLQKHGVSCLNRDKELKDCHHLIFKVNECFPATVVCACVEEVRGTDISTVMAITLGIILLFFLLLITGPPFYRIIRKRFCKKKQRQWIGPTGAGHNVSFHQRSVVNPRSQVSVMSRSNEYSVPPKKTYLSPYPALERISTGSVQPHENSSDNSEYDFHDVHRL